MTGSNVTVTEWHKIPGLAKQYEINIIGQVRILPYEVEEIRNYSGRLRRVTRMIPGRMVKSSVRGRKSDTGQYRVVSLKGMGDARINLLVARTFVGCPYDLTDNSNKRKWRVRHKDGDTLNNHADNLEWVPKGSSTKGQLAAHEAGLAAWEAACREPIEDWVRRFWTEDEIDWSTADYVKTAS